MKKRALLYFPLAVLFLFADSAFAQQWFNGLDVFDTTVQWIGNRGTVEDEFAYSGVKYARAGNDNPYGLGVKDSFPETLRGKNCWVTVSGYVRIPDEDAGGIFVISLTNNGRQLFWQGIDLKKVVKDRRHWFRFSDSVKVPADVTARGQLVSYLWNNRKKGDVYIDDLMFRFRPVQNPGFLPQADFLFADDSGKRKPIYENRFYKIYWSAPDSMLILTGNNGELLAKGAFLFSKFINKKGDTVFVKKKLSLVKARRGQTSGVINFRVKTSAARHKIALICLDASPQMHWREYTRSRKESEIIRQALVFKSMQPVKEVCRANRHSDTADFQPSYWLDKQGVLFGNGNAAWGIYHVPEVSSLQLDTENNLLVVNLDYEKDHPFMRFPLAPDSVDWKLDLSAARYTRGWTAKHGFGFFAGVPVKTLPRIMKNPDGFPAAYIWTEHADFTDLRTNRATYYGNEKIHRPDSAVGGFVKFGIPVTKSVFYDNPDSVTNTRDSGGAFNSLECSLMQDSLFRNFLFDIKNRNVEVCLHTPEQFTTTRARLETALHYMQQHFGSKTWIDHGNNNGPQNNREDLICDGTLKDSPYYALDLWQKYGVIYLNDAYYEEMNTFAGWQFGASIEKPYGGYGDFFPKPDYWQHPTRTGTVYHWPTTKVLYVNKNSLWNYFFNPVQFSMFIGDFGVEINHCYPARVNRSKAFWAVNDKGEIISAPGFDNTLRRMKQLQRKGLLYLTTLGDYLDRRILLDKLIYELLPDGRIKITNPTDSDLKGVTFAVKANAVLVNGLKPARKRFAGELIFWFDLPRKSSALIRMVL